jgi:hypothetical protein
MYMDLFVCLFCAQSAQNAEQPAYQIVKMQANYQYADPFY